MNNFKTSEQFRLAISGGHLGSSENWDVDYIEVDREEIYPVVRCLVRIHHRFQFRVNSLGSWTLFLNVRKH